jgi:hypothetical protein
MVALTGVEQLSLAIGLIVVLAALVVAARLPPPTMVTMAVAILTLAVLAAWVADPGRADNLVPLIGVGIGALATALTSVFDPNNHRAKKKDGEDGDG